MVFGGRPELVVDALKEGPKAIVASAVTVTVMDVLIRGADVLAGVVWQAGRGDAQHVMDGLAATLSHAGGLATTFRGPLALLFGMIGLLVTTVVLFMRSSLLYLVAAFAPIVWSSSVSPLLRGAGRRLVQVTVALVLAKPAISVTLVVGVKLLGHADSASAGVKADGAAVLGTLVSGFACFALAALSPWVVYRLLPTVESAVVASGIVGGWGRAGMSAVQAGLMVKSLGATGAASAATRSLPSRFAATGGSDAAVRSGSSPARIAAAASGPGSPARTRSPGSAGAAATTPAGSRRPAPARPAIPGEADRPSPALRPRQRGAVVTEARIGPLPVW